MVELIFIAGAAYVAYLCFKRSVIKAKADLDAGIEQSNRHHMAMDKEAPHDH